MIRRVVRRSSLLLRVEVKFVDAVQMVVVETVATLVEEVQVVALAKQGTQ